VGASLFALLSVAAVLVVGVVAYDVRIPGPRLAAAAATLLMAVLCYVTVGLAIAAVVRSGAAAQAVSIAAVVVLSFVSGLFTGFGAPLPELMTRVADLFPVLPVTEALQDQFDPFHTGPGWSGRALAVTAAWTVLGALVAAHGLRSTDRSPSATVGGRHTEAGVTQPVASVTVPLPAAEEGHPTVLSTVTAQALAGLRATWRDPGAVFFAVLMPVGLYAFLSTVVPADTMPFGVPVSTSNAASMVAWGVGVTAFLNLPEAVARSRDSGVLKRLRGTPLTPARYLAGRIVTALVVNSALAALVVALGVAALDLTVTVSGVLLGWLLVLLGTLSLAALGFLLATVVPSGRTFGAVGLVVLLPLAFVSDVLLTGGPDWMGTVGSLFPLRHLQHALVAALDPAGASVSWGAVSVMTVWLLAAGALAVRFFPWETGTS
jgi:ABC-type transport system involved in multi-copper enzyme maturation permease subunit